MNNIKLKVGDIAPDFCLKNQDEAVSIQKEKIELPIPTSELPIPNS